MAPSQTFKGFVVGTLFFPTALLFYSSWNSYLANYNYQSLTSIAPASWTARRPRDQALENRGSSMDLATDTTTSMLEELHSSLETMQKYYFQIWLGTWPECIDWTAAVAGTHVSAALYSLTRSLDYDLPPPPSKSHNRNYLPPDTDTGMLAEGQRIENEINKYFSQILTHYFGQNAFAIRGQAYDDMLWVVLGWLSNVRFIRLHSDAHYPASGQHEWYGKQFSGAFAHRARVFYDLAKEGWESRDCGGGMIWNPRLIPYKNAITNQLFISSSIGMYLYFPGDANTSPFAHDPLMTAELHGKSNSDLPVAKAHDKVYLRYAIDAYAWLKNSNMTNDQGLYVDGFHMTRRIPGKPAVCDVRNEMVYTYNQGVILSGLRGMWEATGDVQYLVDGHDLVKNVIKATGFEHGDPSEWRGLGRGGVLEEACDSHGTCSQDGQGFKGIFFHHLSLFCEPLPLVPLVPGLTHVADKGLATVHKTSCKDYGRWVSANAAAAMASKDSMGRYGMWWGLHDKQPDVVVRVPEGAEDYRNEGLGDSERWGEGWSPGMAPPKVPNFPGNIKAVVMDSGSGQAAMSSEDEPWDPNKRGRGRTIETQGSGMAVVRSLHELLALFTDE
jgi:Glycosyl hydrolase family 76